MTKEPDIKMQAEEDGSPLCAFDFSPDTAELTTKREKKSLKSSPSDTKERKKLALCLSLKQVFVSPSIVLNYGVTAAVCGHWIKKQNPSNNNLQNQNLEMLRREEEILKNAKRGFGSMKKNPSRYFPLDFAFH